MRPIGQRALCIFAAAVGGCGVDSGEQEERERFRVNGAAYSVPARHVRSIRREPPGFVRIHDRDSPIDLVFDARLQGRTDEAGAPLLFSINDGDYARLSYWRTPQGAPVVCREAAASPRGGCGIPVESAGATWSVIVPQSRIGEADVLRRRAEELLELYRF